MVEIDIDDGYAAARLLLPEIRARLAAELGDPFGAGVPGRERLLAWPLDDVEGAVASTRLREGFDKSPYPISAATLVVSVDGGVR